jgi:hypothetical protein
VACLSQRKPPSSTSRRPRRSGALRPTTTPGHIASHGQLPMVMGRGARQCRRWATAVGKLNLGPVHCASEGHRPVHGDVVVSMRHCAAVYIRQDRAERCVKDEGGEVVARWATPPARSGRRTAWRRHRRPQSPRCPTTSAATSFFSGPARSARTTTVPPGTSPLAAPVTTGAGLPCVSLRAAAHRDRRRYGCADRDGPARLEGRDPFLRCAPG